MDDLVAAIKSGIPTAIFEDPLPLIQGSVTGTYEPRRTTTADLKVEVHRRKVI